MRISNPARIMHVSMGLTALLVMLLLWSLLIPHYQALGRQAISRHYSSDFYKFYLSAQRYTAGQSMYWQVPARLREGEPCHPDTPPALAAATMPKPNRTTLGGEVPCLGPNLNPPIANTVFLPLSRLPYDMAWWIWSISGLFASACALTLITREFAWTGWRRWGATLLLFTLFCAFYPTIANFSLGQMGTHLLLPLTWVWVSLRRNQPVAAGLSLGLAMSVKPFLLVIWVGTWGLGAKRAAVWAAGTALALMGLGLALYGTVIHQEYLDTTGNISWLATNWNGSLAGFIERTAISVPALHWPESRTATRALSTVVAVSLLLWWVKWLPRRCGQAIENRADQLLATGIPLSLIISPLGWAYYLPWFALTIAARLSSERRACCINTQQRSLLALCICMAEIPIILNPSPTPHTPAQWWGVDSWYFYIQLCVLTWTMRRPLPGISSEK